MTNRRLRHNVLRDYIAGPFIWAMIVPVVFADICVEIYHHVCFPLYNMELVKRSHYIRIVDREKLPYLTGTKNSSAPTAATSMAGFTTHR